MQFNIKRNDVFLFVTYKIKIHEIGYKDVLRAYSKYRKNITETGNPNDAPKGKIWTSHENAALIEGVQIFGIDKWLTIKNCFTGFLDKTPNEMRERWNYLKKSKNYKRVKLNS